MSRLEAPKVSHSVVRQRAVERSTAWSLPRTGETWLPYGYRAELASAFIGRTLDLPCDIPNHANYIASRVRKLKEDKREIFRAAADAQRIADYLLAFHPDFAEVAGPGSGGEHAAASETEFQIATAA
jgi:antirestriction protein ArdC